MFLFCFSSEEAKAAKNTLSVQKQVYKSMEPSRPPALKRFVHVFSIAPSFSRFRLNPRVSPHPFHTTGYMHRRGFRQFSKSTLDREAYLLKYVTEKVENRVEITIAEGWGILKEYGFTVLFDTLTDEAKQNKAPFGNKGFSSLYTIGFRLVSCGDFMDHSSQIYANLTEDVRGFLTERVVAPLLDANLAGTPMIAKFSQAWENTKSMTKWVHRLFAHLDNGYVINSGGAFPTVVGLCMSMFRDVAFSGTCERVRTGTLRLVEEERDGKDVDREAIRSCVEVFKVVGGLERSQCLTVATVEKLLKRDQDLSIYRSEFEEPFLLESQQYYEKKAEIWREDSVPAYLKRCEKSLADELERASRYLHPNTEPALVLRVEKALLSGVKGSIQTELVERVGTGMLAMLHGDQRDDLKRMFDLFSREGANLKEVPMAECFERFVSSEGCKIIDIRRAEVAALPAGKKETAADGTGTVVALLNLYARCEAMVVELFSRHLSFQRAIRNAFQIFINDNASEKVSNTELLVAYVDALLKGKEGTEKLDEGQQQERLDNSMRLFEFIADKDVYEALFKDALAKRLLNNKVTSMDMEMHIVTKLKLAQGPPFTANIEGMLTDFKLIDESSSEFAAYLASSHPSAPESSNPLLGGGGGSGSLSSAQAAGALGAPLGRTEQRVQLLYNGFWPLQGGAEGIVLSGTFATLVNRYTSFFEEKHSGKKVRRSKRHFFLCLLVLVLCGSHIFFICLWC